MNFGFSCIRKFFCCIPSIYAFGRNKSLRLGHVELNDQYYERGDTFLPGAIHPRIDKQSDWVSVATSETVSYGIHRDGSLWGWGAGGRQAFDASPHPVFVDAGPWTKVTSSKTHTLAIKQDGTLWHWGDVLPQGGTGSGAKLRARLSTQIRSAEIISGGSYSKTPSVSISSTDGGSGAAAAAEMQFYARVYNISPQDGGQEYKSTPTVVLSDGETRIEGTVSMSYSVQTITVTDGGFGYTSAPTVSVESLWTVTQPVVAAVTKMGCLLTGVTIQSGGSGYAKPPDVYVNGERIADARVVVQNGAVTSVSLNSSIKVNEPTATITFSDGNAIAVARTRANYHVVEVTVSQAGSGYKYQAPTVKFTGGGGGAGAAATANVSLPVLYQVSFLSNNKPVQIGPFYGSVGPFSSPPVLEVSGGSPVREATFSAVPAIATVVGLKITSGGSGYTANPTTRPIATFQRQEGDAYFGQQDADAVLLLEPSQVSSISVISPGSGYQAIPGDLDVRVTSASGTGCKAKAIVGTSGGIASIAIESAGEWYAEEPQCEVATTLIYPRQIGSDTWTDISAGVNFSAGIKSDSKPYWWSNKYPPLTPDPTPIGQGLILSGPGGDGTEILPAPNFPGQQASYGGYGFMTSVGTGYTSAPSGYALHGPTTASSVVIGYDQAQSVFLIDSSDTLWKMNATSVWALPAATRQNSATETTEVIVVGGPTTRSSEQTDTVTDAGTYYAYFNGLLSLVKQGGGISFLRSGGTGYSKKPKVSVQGMKWHWRIYKNEYINSEWSIDEYYNIPVYPYPAFDYGSYKRFERTKKVSQTGEITSSSLPVETPTPWSESTRFQVKEGSIIWPAVFYHGELLGSPPPGSLPPVPPNETEYETVQRVKWIFDGPWTDDDGNYVYESIEVLKRSAYYTLEWVLVETGSVVITDATGSGAEYEKQSPHKTLHGPGPCVVGEGFSWDFVTRGGIGVRSDGTVVDRLWIDQTDALLAVGGTPLPQAQQGYGTVGCSGEMIVRDDQTAWFVAKSAWEPTPPTIVGDLELTVVDSGEGYTEPATVKISPQHPSVAQVDVTLDGKVVAIGVVDPGKGYNSPPTVTISGSGTGAAATATIVGPVSSVSVTAPGSGYRKPPKVVFSQPGYSATATATLDGSGGVASVVVSEGGMYRSPPSVSFVAITQVTGINVTSRGSKYTSPPEVQIAGGFGGSGAKASAVIDGRVTEVVLTAGGKYKTAPSVVFTGGGGSGAAAVATLSDDGAVSAVTLTSGGSMYQSPPLVTFVSQNGAGAGAGAYTSIEGEVDSVVVSDGGQDYGEAPQVFFLGGGGTGAAATATVGTYGSGAAATSRIDGELLYVTVTNMGSGYESTPTVTVSGGDNATVNEADRRLRIREITQEERDSIVDSVSAKLQARIYGTASATVASPGSSYSTSGSSEDGIMSSSYRLLGSDTRGRWAHRAYNSSSSFDDLSLYGTNVNVPASVNSSGGISSVQIPTVSNEYTYVPPTYGYDLLPLEFSSPPQVAFHNTAAVRAVMTAKVIPRLARVFGVKSQGARFGWSYAHLCLTDTIWKCRKNPSLASRLSAEEIGSQNRVVTSFPVFQYYADAGVGIYPFVPLAGLRSMIEKSFYKFSSPVKFSSPPAISVESDIGSGATASVTLDTNGFIQNVSITNGGSGYGSFTRLVMDGGKVSTVNATADAHVDDGRVVAISVAAQGSGYIATPDVVIHGGGGRGATAVAVMESDGALNKVVGIKVTSEGRGYTSAPTVTVVNRNGPWSTEVGRIVDYAALALAIASQESPYIEHEELWPLDREVWLRFTSQPKAGGASSTENFTTDDGRTLTRWNRFELFVDSGRVEDVILESSTYARRTHGSLVRRLPTNAVAVVSGACDRPAVVSLTRPAWSNVVDSYGDGAYSGSKNVWEYGLMVRDETQ